MGTMQAEVFEAFRDMGAAEDKALKAASVLGKRDDDFTKAVADLKLDNASIKGELSTLRWMVGFNLTLTVLGFGSVLGCPWRFVK